MTRTRDPDAWRPIPGSLTDKVLAYLEGTDTGARRTSRIELDMGLDPDDRDPLRASLAELERHGLTQFREIDGVGFVYVELTTRWTAEGAPNPARIVSADRLPWGWAWHCSKCPVVGTAYATADEATLAGEGHVCNVRRIAGCFSPGGVRFDR